MGIVQVENAISEPICSFLMKVFDRHESSVTTRDHNGKVVYFANVNEALVHKILSALVTKVIKDVEPPIAIETSLLARLGPGGYHVAHADNTRQDKDGKWVPNHTPNRVHTALYYLNNDFEGGEIFFPQHNLEVKPKQGLLVHFPSGKEYVHGVNKIISGYRYSVNLWFINDNKSKSNL